VTRDSSLPVDPERLRARFPALTDDDLDAYVTVSRRVLGDARTRGRTMRALMQAAEAARQKESAAKPLTDEESLALRYRRAIEKMQGRVS
jgi:hypothetical protein